MGEPTDDDPTASRTASSPAPRGDSIAAAASRALRARRAAAAPAAPEPETEPEPEPETEPDTLPDTETDAEPDATPEPAAAEAEPDADAPAPETAPSPAAKAPAKAPAKPAPAAKAKPATRPATTPPAAATPRAAAPGRAKGILGRTTVLVLAGVAAVLLVATVITGVLAATTKQNGDLAFAATRDAVIVDATTDIVTLNSLDYRTAATGINSWLTVSTGTLHDQIVSQKSAIVSQVQQSKVITTARVLAIAVSELDDRSGSATVIASVEQTVTPAGGSAAKKYDRFSAGLTLTGGSWKLNQFDLVPV